MKILHIIPNLRKGGAERLVTDIVRELATRESVEVRMVLFRDEIAYDIQDIRHLVHIIPASVHLSLWRKNKFQIDTLQQFLEDFQPDIIHTHLFEAEIVSRFCIYPKAKWFSHLHDNMIQFKNFELESILDKNAITNYYEKKVLFKRYKKNGGTHFFSISKYSDKFAESIQTSYQLTLLPNAIDVKRFQKPADNPITKGNIEMMFNEHNQSSNISFKPKSQTQFIDRRWTLNLINIGSFTENKNQQFLTDIILKLNEIGIRVNFYFLGEGDCFAMVQEKAIKLGVQDQCQFLGNIENVEEYLWKSDVYVHVAKSEALGLTIIEAMAAGLSVITLDGGGNRDLMINGKNGFLIEKQDPKEFANRILEVYQNKEISDFNAEFAKQFDIKTYCDKLLEIYQS